MSRHELVKGIEELQGLKQIQSPNCKKYFNMQVKVLIMPEKVLELPELFSVWQSIDSSVAAPYLVKAKKLTGNCPIRNHPSSTAEVEV